MSNNLIGLLTAALLVWNTWLTRKNGQKADDVHQQLAEAHPPDPKP